MLSVMLIWLYIAATALPVGTAFVCGFGRILTGKQTGNEPVRAMMCGVMAAGVYAEYFSLAAGVSEAAVVLWIVLAGICGFCFKEELAEAVCIAAGGCCKAAGGQKTVCRGVAAVRLLVFVLLFVVTAYCCSRGYIHYDSDLYHAQSIRWIEEYGCVKGLANLHNRFGYNSAAFALSALFSFAFLGGQSFHTVQGFLALLLAFECMKLLRFLPFGYSHEKTAFGTADFLRIAAFFYLFSTADEIVSPASDYFMVLIAFYIFIRFAALAEEGCTDWYPYALLCFLALYDVTVKLSAVMMVLIVLLPAVRMLKERKYISFALCIAAGAVIVLPFLIRNVILTGYLVYPYPSVDLFNVPWKVPAADAARDAAEITVWGRGMTDVRLIDAPITEWFGNWFRSLAGIDRLWLLAAAACGTVSFFTTAIRVGIRKTQEEADTFLLIAVLAASTLFWFINAPLIRYGCVFVYSLAAAGAGVLYSLIPAGNRDRILAVLVCLFLCYKAAAVGREELRSLTLPYWIRQQDYNSYEVDTYEINGIIFYYPVSGDQTGYVPFPASQSERDGEIGMFGNSLKEGFYTK